MDGRASYTIDPLRSTAFESMLTGDGLYLESECSEVRGDHWRVTADPDGIAGHKGDVQDQYHRNSHAAFMVRYSF